MADPKQENFQENPTADYRKYPKGPNFLGIVILSSIVLLLVLIAGYFIVHHVERKMPAHTPDPTPNSLVLPAHPRSLVG